MVEFTVPQVAFNLETTKQYIYKVMPDLIERKMAYRTEEGKPMVYDTGLDYLRNKRIKNYRVAQPNNVNSSNMGYSNLQETAKQKQLYNNETTVNQEEKEQTMVDFYKNLYEEIKIENKEIQEKHTTELAYWKQLYEKKDNEFTEFINKNTLMLDTSKKETQNIKEDLENAMNRNGTLIKEGVAKDEKIYELEQKYEQLSNKKWWHFFKK